MVADASERLRAEPFGAWCPRPSVWRVGLALALGVDLGLALLLSVGAVLESPERLTSLGAPWSALGYRRSRWRSPPSASSPSPASAGRRGGSGRSRPR